ncbi:hypothetical protein ILYODFUR_027811 [Ilyodon furcidens]|uniref:Ig-like domain-containing protein n=1 Tax=Ilyodon furcidens TaxID=33524 RepID=A0ABV0T0R6_9TELE
MSGVLNYFEEEEGTKMKALFVNVLLLCSLCEAEVSKISEPVSVQILKLRKSATIECYIKSLILKRVWYKLTAGRRLQLVATGDSQSNQSVIAEEFQRRFSVKFDSINSHLRISATSWDDVGTYFCGVMDLHKVQFGSGTFLLRKGLKLTTDSVAQQPEPHSVQSGDSLTLSCTVHSGQCPAEHTRVTWLKNSYLSAPEMTYASENENSICQRAGSGETCVHKLFLKNINSDDAGTSHCVAAAYGQVLLGKGALFKNGLTSGCLSMADQVSTLLIFIIVIICALGVYLGSLVWIIDETNCCFGSCAEPLASSQTQAEVQHEEHVQTNISKGQENSTWTECVYINVNKLN